MPQSLRVTVSRLQPGDKLAATGATVLGVSVGVRTPARKRDVHLRYRNGREALATWNAGTTVQVERQETQS